MIFVSWSGARGQRVAAVLHRTLTEAFREAERPIEVVFSPLAQRVGGDWRLQLDSLLATCDIGVVVLDPRALKSPWVAYEAGALSARTGEKPGIRLLAVLLNDSAGPLAGTPYDAFQCALLTKEGFERLFESLFIATGEPPARPMLVALAHRAYEHVASIWSEIRDGEAVSGSGLQEALADDIRRFRAFGLLASADAAAYTELSAVSRGQFTSVDTSLLREMGEIARLFGECAERSHGDFGPLAIEWAVKNLLLDSKEQLSEIGRGRLPVRNRAPVREFWLESIFGRVSTSVWTTNVATPGANMGGSPDRHLLEAQASAIRRGVAVTRVFVYNPSMSSDEAAQRRNLMRRQIEIGIDVRVITEQDFRTKSDAENARKRIGSDDFMVIDNEFVYLTTPDETDNIEATLFDGRQHHTRLAAARAFRDVVNGWADSVTERNVDRFPELPA